MAIGYDNQDEMRKGAGLMLRAVANIPNCREESGNIIITDIPLLYYVPERKHVSYGGGSYWNYSSIPYRSIPSGYNRRVKIDLPMFIETEPYEPPMFMDLERIAKETRAKEVTRIDFDEDDSPKYKETHIDQSLALLDILLIIMEDYEGTPLLERVSYHFEGFGLKDAPAKMVRRFANKHRGLGRTREY